MPAVTPEVERMRRHLAERHDMPDDLDEATVRKTFAKMIASGKLSTDKYIDITAPNNTSGERTSHRTNPTMKDSNATLEQVYGRSGSVNVKRPSEIYSEKRLVRKNKFGNAVERNGEAVAAPSERELALVGVWLRRMALSSVPGVRPMDEHELGLEKELYIDTPWVGSLTKDGPCMGKEGVRLFEALNRRATDFVGTGTDGTTSGGTYLVPYYFDADIVTYPLLYNELAPMVDMRDLTTSNQVKTGTLGNPPAVTWNGSEGSNALIGLETTDGLATAITNNVYNLGLAVTIGRDTLSDSPVNLAKEMTQIFGREFAYQTDKVIAIGDGTTQPKGLSNTSGMTAVTAVNSTAGPFKVTDVENMISAIPYQYLQKSDPSVAFVCSNSCWWKIRGISVSSTDQRRIFGYDYQAHMLGGWPVKIQNDIPANDLFFGKLNLYRMWRRLGMQLEMTNDGKALRQANEVLITGRTRLAGSVINAAGFSVMTNAPLH